MNGLPKSRLDYATLPNFMVAEGTLAPKPNCGETCVMKRLTLLLTLSMALTFASYAQAPKTARDFFMALPSRYFSIECCAPENKPYRQAKAEYLKQYLNVDDPANGYISAHGDAAQEGFALALFKRPNGSYLIGFYTYGEGGVEDTPWTVFLDYKNGKWTDVSRREITKYSKAKYIYELPRRGTTVEVFAKDENGQDWYKGKKLYDLEWRNGKFVSK